MRCKSHADVEATRQCTACMAGWCDGCAKRVGIRQACPDCGHVLGTADAEVKTLSDTLRDTMHRLITIESLTTVAALAGFYAVLGFSKLALVVLLSTLVVYYFAIVRHVGEGNAGMPGPSDDELGRTIGYAFRGLACAVVGFLPVIGYLVATEERDLATLIALVIVGQLYLPAAVLAVAFSSSTLGALWPVAWVKVIARAPSAYLRFAVIWIGSILVGVGLEVGTEVLSANVLGLFVQGALWTLFWFGQAVLVGHYIRENRTVYGLD